ncbi:Riboflavin biosynthesis protein RibBA, partial [Cichlidogyrus casuarinus]
DPVARPEPWSASQAYANSKLAVNLFAQQLERDWGNRIQVYTVITGGMVHTGLNRELISKYPLFVQSAINQLCSGILLTPHEGAQSALHCAVSANPQDAHANTRKPGHGTGSGMLYRHCKPVNWPQSCLDPRMRASLLQRFEALIARTT